MALWKWKVSRRLVRIRRFHLRYVVREVWSLYDIPMRTYEVARFADLHEALCHLSQWKQRRNEVCYCRFGDDSDVYLRRSGGEIVCAFCALEPDHGDVPLDDIDMAWGHLLEHAGAGHKVPGDAFHRVREENRHRPAPSNQA